MIVLNRLDEEARLVALARMTVRIERIAPPLVEKMFPQCVGWLERAVARCKDEEIGDVREERAAGDAELWVAYIGKELSGVFVTQLEQSKRRRVSDSTSSLACHSVIGLRHSRH